MASALAHQWLQKEGAQALGPNGEGLGSPWGCGGALSGAGTLHTCSPNARERVMWLLLELLSRQALAAEMLFQEEAGGRAKGIRRTRQGC